MAIVTWMQLAKPPEPIATKNRLAWDHLFDAFGNDKFKPKVDFRDTKVPIDLSTLPLPKTKVFEGEELEEIHERMRQWLREYDESMIEEA